MLTHIVAVIVYDFFCVPIDTVFEHFIYNLEEQIKTSGLILHFTSVDQPFFHALVLPRLTANSEFYVKPFLIDTGVDIFPGNMYNRLIK